MNSTYQRMLEDRFYLYHPWIPILKSIEAEAVRNLELKHPILDIGCGNGLFASFCFKDKIDIGLDCDEKAVKDAKKRGVYGELEVGDACALPFSDNYFNTVISVCAVEHILDLDKVLSNAHRVLKKGGKFIITVPSSKFAQHLFVSCALRFIGLKKMAQLYGEKKNKKSGHVHIYDMEKWIELLKNSNFQVNSIDYIVPKETILLWSFFHSVLFKIIFLPFRIFRDLNIKFIDNLLRAALNKLLATRISKYPKVSKDDGGYLLIQVSKS